MDVLLVLGRGDRPGYAGDHRLPFLTGRRVSKAGRMALSGNFRFYRASGGGHSDKAEGVGLVIDGLVLVAVSWLRARAVP